MSTLLQVKDLQMHFPLRNNKKVVIKAVNGVSFEVKKGQTLGLVGESGCGKTTTARMIIRLYKPSSGDIIFNGQNISNLNDKQLQPFRRDIQMVFQDPYASLHPRMTVEKIILDPMLVHNIGTPAQRQERLAELMELVGLDIRFAQRYPHEFSGGQRQRISIARALALNPQLLLLDEPVSALDVSVQSQILNLLQSLQESLGIAYIFISHNLSVVDYMCQEIIVMYLGRIVEQASREELFNNPAHPYTQALLSAIPSMDIHQSKQKIILKGDIPSPANPPGGCCFHTRCPKADAKCQTELPPPVQLNDNHLVYCWHN